MKKILPLFFLYFGLSAKADSWTQKTSYPGLGQELPISFSIGDKGYAGCGAYANDFWEYDPVNNSWTQKANIPGAIFRRGGLGFSIGDKGYAGTGEGSLNDFYEYDPATNTWTTKASLNTGRGFAAGFSIGNKGYIGCGYTGICLDDFWEYDPSTNSWTQKSSMPFGRMQCVSFSIAGKGYITTGYDGANDLNDMWEYDPALNNWTQKADLPAAARLGARGFVICDKGNVMTGGESPYYDDLWQFDPVLNQWIQKTDVPGGGRDDGASFTIGNKGYFGLGQLLGYNYTNDFWEYTPDVNCNTSATNFSASDTTLCEKFCISYFDSSANNPTAWYWIFPGGSPSFSTDQNPTNICYNTSGLFDVTLITTNANGTDTLMLPDYITVYPTPPFPSITQVGYTLTSSPANSYQWQFNAVDIPGATNQSYTILQTGYYTVVVGDSNSCKNSFTVYVLISGINDVMGDANILIYPNPSDGHFIVELPNGFIADEISIDVVNTLGQKVFSSTESRSVRNAHWKKQIDLSNVACGTYFIDIKTENEFVRKKILIAM